ncbi:MAG: hypothetical protein E4H20_07285 [Spirochaetales bacterium]|nr:MAG: hypothetical protein E4H20_07285 [Spirochaetales bacterium]
MIVAHAIKGRMPKTSATKGRMRFFIRVPFRYDSKIYKAMTVPSLCRFSEWIVFNPDQMELPA